MKNKLRLLVTSKCNRNCLRCCNKDWNLDVLPVCTSFVDWDEIILTGGEPMLKPNLVKCIINNIRKENNIAPIYLYTAHPCIELVDLLYTNTLQGCVLTLHDQDDINSSFIAADSMLALLNYRMMSIRLNVFKGVKLPTIKAPWNIKKEIEWIENCPLPKDETFMKL